MANSWHTRFVTTRTPLRVSFAGGGTDIPSFYENDSAGGAVLSTAINRCLYVTVKAHDPLFGEKYRVSYSVTEHVQNLDDLKNEIARECLRLVPVSGPVYVSVIADLPAYSGLGSSSAFAVGLLNALHTFRHDQASPVQLAEEAAYIEIKVLKRPIGKQDHYAAAFGGMSFYRFLPGGQVVIEPSTSDGARLENLFDHFMIFWTGIQRDSAMVLGEMQGNISNKRGELTSMRDLAAKLHRVVLESGDIAAFGRIIGQNWELKRGLASTITNPQIDNWYYQGIEAGAIGGKLCGAGGGGFLLYVVPPDRQANVVQALKGLTHVRFSFEPHGSHVVTNSGG